MLQLSLPSLQPQLHHPQARLQWKRCSEIPVGMDSAKAVVMGKKVYVGGGDTDRDHVRHHVFQYNTSTDEWSCLPPHPEIVFAMAQFQRNLITVGGQGAVGGVDITGKVYRFKEEFQEWEEFLKPMPTARYGLSVATTQSAIIASGGSTGVRDDNPVVCATVEVYSNETSQWYTADPLPAPYYAITSIIIADTCYLLGGNDAGNTPVSAVLYASLTSLLQKATSPTLQSASHTSVWKSLPDTPLKMPAAASLSGHLITMGGWKGKISSAVIVARVLAAKIGVTLPIFPTLYTFLPFNNSWVKITNGALPQPRIGCTAVQLSSNTMIVIGGRDRQTNLTRTVFKATVTI